MENRHSEVLLQFVSVQTAQTDEPSKLLNEIFKLSGKKCFMSNHLFIIALEKTRLFKMKEWMKGIFKNEENLNF